MNLLALRLRRYARALTQASPHPSGIADQLVHATLLHMRDREFLPRNCDVAVTGFAVLTQMHRDQVQAHRRHAAGGVPSAGPRRDARLVNFDPSSGRNKGLLDGLADLTLDEREALLLVAIEQFSYAQASQILQVSQASLVARLAQARNRLGAVLTAASYPPDAGARRGSHLRLVK